MSDNLISIKATFVGRNSCGYIRGYEYDLNLAGTTIYPVSWDQHGRHDSRPEPVVYESLPALMRNWTDIRPSAVWQAHSNREGYRTYEIIYGPTGPVGCKELEPHSVGPVIGIHETGTGWLRKPTANTDSVRLSVDQIAIIPMSLGKLIYKDGGFAFTHGIGDLKITMFDKDHDIAVHKNLREWSDRIDAQDGLKKVVNPNHELDLEFVRDQGGITQPEDSVLPDELIKAVADAKYKTKYKTLGDLFELGLDLRKKKVSDYEVTLDLDSFDRDKK